MRPTNGRGAERERTMSGQMSLDFVTLFENDEVKVYVARGETKVDFKCGDDKYRVTHLGAYIEVMGNIHKGQFSIVPTSGNVCILKPAIFYVVDERGEMANEQQE